MISETTSEPYNNFWHSIEHARGATDPKIGRYVVKNLNGEEDNQKTLEDVWSQFNAIIRRNFHFSEEERAIGKRILGKLELITQESRDDWDQAIGLLKRLFVCGLWDYSFMIMNDKCLPRLKKTFETYTKIQWINAHPETPFKEICISGSMKSGDNPTRYYPMMLPDGTVKRRESKKLGSNQGPI